MPIIRAYPQAPTGQDLARAFFGGMDQAQQSKRDEVNTALAIARLLGDREELRAREADRKDRRDLERRKEERDAEARTAGTEALLAEMRRLASMSPGMQTAQDPSIVGPPPPAGQSGLDPAVEAAFRRSSPETQRSLLASQRSSVDDLIRQHATDQQQRTKQAAVKFLMDQLGGVDENGVPVSKAGQRLLNELKMKEAGFSTGAISYSDLTEPALPSGQKPIDVLRQMRIATAEIDQQTASIEALRNRITGTFTPVVINGVTYTPEMLTNKLAELRNRKAEVLSQMVAGSGLDPGVIGVADPGAPLIGSPPPIPAASPSPGASPAAPSAGAQPDYQTEAARQLQELIRRRAEAAARPK